MRRLRVDFIGSWSFLDLINFRLQVVGIVL